MPAPVRLRFLGSGDAFGSGGRMQPCLLLEGGGAPLLADCGATAVIAMKRAGIDPSSIGAVALTHLHGDHFAGLAWLILDGEWAGRSSDLLIAGPRGAEERLQRLMEALYPGAANRRRPFATEFVEYEERIPRAIGDAVVTPFGVRHEGGAPAYALRVRYGGRTIAYSGDTEWTDSLAAAAGGSDLFVCECNCFADRVPGHIDLPTLMRERERLETKRLVITHMGSAMLEHLEEIELETAEDGSVIEL